eukprot:COSAG02_NODE_1269_length_13533_cov_7.935016_10_plen_115_part_00
MSLTSARNDVADQQQPTAARERGAGDGSGSRGSSPWLREVNPLNLSIADSDDEQEAGEIDTVGSNSDDQDREDRMTPMEIRSAASASRKSGSRSGSVRLPTSDEDEGERDGHSP